MLLQSVLFWLKRASRTRDAKTGVVAMSRARGRGRSGSARGGVRRGARGGRGTAESLDDDGDMAAVLVDALAAAEELAVACAPDAAAEAVAAAGRLVPEVGGDAAAAAGARADAPETGTPAGKKRAKPLAELTKRHRSRRYSEAEHAILEAAGGDSADASACARVMLNAASRLEADSIPGLRAKLLEELMADEATPGSAPLRLAGAWLQSLLVVLIAASAALPRFLPRILASVSVSRTWLAHIRSAGVSVGKATWRSAVCWRRNNEPKDVFLQANKGGQPALLEREDVQQEVLGILEGLTQETSRFCVVERKSCHKERKVVPIRTLPENLQATWLGSDRLKALLSLRSFYRFCAKYAKHIQKGSKRVDLCDTCMSYQNMVLPKLKEVLAQANSLATLPGCESYFAALGERNVDAESLRGLLSHIDAEKRSFREVLSLKVQGELHAAEAKVAHSLRKHLRLRELYEHHREAAARQHERYHWLRGNLPDGCVLIRVDYKQNITLPLCANETGNMWYARARFEVTCFGPRLHNMSEALLGRAGSGS